MNIIKRISNVWKLSAFEPEMEPYIHGLDENVSHVGLVVKKPQQKAEFIPYKKVDPIKQLIEEQL